jgi:DNA-binding NarL/FixJ family response regulator
VSKKRKSKQPAIKRPVLTERERQVLTGVVAGKTNAEIGSELALSYESIKTYINRLRVKLGVRTKVDIAVFAVQHSLLEAA